MKRLALTALVLFYFPFILWLSGHNLERSGLLAYAALVSTMVALMVYFYPYWREKK